MPRTSKPIAVAAALTPAPADFFVGTSGWAYPTWKPAFYPVEVPSRSFLQHYASVLTAVEVNYTFRTLPTPVQVQAWLAASPPGFRFSFKAPQRITHFRRLQDCEEALDQLFAALEPARLAGKLGPVLFQLPPNFAADPAKLSIFLNYPTLQGPAAPAIAFEFRHESWFQESIYALLRRAGAALCIADTDTLATPDVLTGSFRCYRLRRDGGYSAAELASFAERFTSSAREAPTYVFLRHQEAPTGALNALALLEAANKLVSGTGRQPA